MANIKYDWKITTKKFFVIAVEVIIAGMIVSATDEPFLMVLVPAFEALKNYIKNR